MFGSCHQLFVTFASIIISVIGMTLPNDIKIGEPSISLLWRFGYAGPLAFSIIQVILLFTVYKYESPSYYAINGKEQMVIITC